MTTLIGCQLRIVKITPTAIQNFPQSINSYQRLSILINYRRLMHTPATNTSSLGYLNNISLLRDTWINTLHYCYCTLSVSVLKGLIKQENKEYDYSRRPACLTTQLVLLVFAFYRNGLCSLLSIMRQYE